MLRHSLAYIWQMLIHQWIVRLDLAQLRSEVKSLSPKSDCAESNPTQLADVCVDQAPDSRRRSIKMQISKGPPSAVDAERPPRQNRISPQARSRAQESAVGDPDALQVIKACNCACHTMIRIRTPSMLQRAFGSLLIKSSGLYGSPACSEFSCNCRPNTRINVSYRFPEWLLCRVVSSAILVNKLSGPQLSLTTPRIVSYTSDIFLHAMSGNIEGIVTLFEKGLAAPSDVNNLWGYSALHVSLKCCKHLTRSLTGTMYSTQ